MNYNIVKPLSSVSNITKIQSPRIFSLLNPLGIISDMVNSYFSYQERIREIELQIIQVKEQASVMSEKIQAEKEIILTQLENQRKKVEDYINLTREELYAANIERKKILEVISLLSKGMLDNNISIYEKTEYRITISILSEVFINSGKQSMEKFSDAAKNISMHIEKKDLIMLN